MKITIKMFTLIMGFILALPGFAFAHGFMPDNHGGSHEKPSCCQDEHRDHMGHHDWQARMAEKEKKILGWVDQYSPQQKAEWTRVLAERKALVNKWLSPENAKKREQWKKEHTAKMQELKKQLDAGKITKEEFMKKVHEGKHFGAWHTFHELKKAAEAKDRVNAKKHLDQLLMHYKEQNKKMNEMLK